MKLIHRVQRKSTKRIEILPTSKTTSAIFGVFLAPMKSRFRTVHKLYFFLPRLGIKTAQMSTNATAREGFLSHHNVKKAHVWLHFSLQWRVSSIQSTDIFALPIFDKKRKRFINIVHVQISQPMNGIVLLATSKYTPASLTVLYHSNKDQVP